MLYIYEYMYAFIYTYKQPHIVAVAPCNFHSDVHHLSFVQNLCHQHFDTQSTVFVQFIVCIHTHTYSFFPYCSNSFSLFLFLFLSFFFALLYTSLLCVLLPSCCFTVHTVITSTHENCVMENFHLFAIIHNGLYCWWMTLKWNGLLDIYISCPCW